MLHSDYNDAQAKPSTVRAAVACLGVWLTLSLAHAAIGIWRIDAARPNALAVLAVSCIGSLASLAFNGFLLYRIDCGRAGARIAFTVFRVIGVPLSLLFASSRFAYGSLSVWLGAAETLSAFMGVILLFLPASNAWFRTISDHEGP